MSWYKQSKQSDNIDPKELEMGVKVEREHMDVYNEIKKILGDDMILGEDMPWTKEEFCEKIARAHLKELKDYYTRLKKMEN